MNKFTMLVSIPGAGKSTYAQKRVAENSNVVWVSSDAIREELWGDANDQQNPAQVFEEMFARTVAAMKSGKEVIYDATNLSAKKRKATLTRLRQALRFQFCARAIVITCSISECKRRQGDRDRKVPDEVIDRMVRQFQTPWYNEGWDAINIINRGKLQNIAREHWRMLGESHDNHHHTRSLEMHCAECEGKMIELTRDASIFSDYAKNILREAAYQHDLGKHKTKVFFDAKGDPSEEAHYYCHENVGAYLWLSGDRVSCWNNEAFLLIGVLIQWHMQPYHLCDKNGDYHTKLKEWCDKHGFDIMFYESICLMHEADKAAH